MPHLIKGHLRFTDEDYKEQEFKERLEKKYRDVSFLNLNELLKIETQQFEYMKDKHILRKFDTTGNIKKGLTNALALIVAMANKEGLELNDLL